MPVAAHQTCDELRKEVDEIICAATPHPFGAVGIWYDDFSLKLGDSLRQSIDRGLARSRFGVVILSARFFEKHWPQQELNGLATREVGAENVILPVWHGVGFVEVRNYSVTLADRLAVQTKEGLSHVVEKIMDVVGKSAH